MSPRRSNASMLKYGLLLLTVSLALVLPGCKKQAEQPKSTPMPQKPQQAAPVQAPNPSGQPQAKPVQANQTSAKSAGQQKSPVQQQQSSAKRPPVAGGVNLDFTNRRDPFKPYIQAPAPQQAAAKSGRKTRDALPIQSFDTERFKISGIITGVRENSALIIDPTGKGYVVKVGTMVGNNDGVVRRITDNTVEVEENFRDDNGRVRKRTVKLSLLRKK